MAIIVEIHSSQCGLLSKEINVDDLENSVEQLFGDIGQAVGVNLAWAKSLNKIQTIVIKFIPTEEQNNG